MIANAGDLSTIEVGNGYRFVPAPRNSAMVSGFASAAQSVMSALSSAASPVLGIQSSYQDLLTVQLEAQRQMMMVSMVSNVEKSKHETQMAPVRNIRVG